MIADPLRDELYAALRGHGAWRGGDETRLQVRRLRRIANAVVAADPGAPDDPEAHGRVAALQPQVRAVRSLGSTALSLTLLATGRLDGVIQVRGLDAVDIAAAGLISAGAGAHVTDADGGPWLIVDRPHRGTGIAAARPGLHRRLLRSGRGELAIPIDQPGSASSKWLATRSPASTTWASSNREASSGSLDSMASSSTRCSSALASVHLGVPRCGGSGCLGVLSGRRIADDRLAGVTSLDPYVATAWAEPTAR